MDPSRASLPALARKARTPCWENLEKLVWTDGFAFESYGVRIGVRTNSFELLPRLRERLPPAARLKKTKTVDRYFSVILGGQKTESRVRHYHLVYGDHSRLARSHDLTEILDVFESWVGLSV